MTDIKRKTKKTVRRLKLSPSDSKTHSGLSELQKIEQSVKGLQASAKRYDNNLHQLEVEMGRLVEQSSKVNKKLREHLKRRKTSQNIFLFNVALTSLAALSLGLSLVATATLFIAMIVSTVVGLKFYELVHKATMDVVNKLRAAQEKRFFEKHPKPLRRSRHDNPTLEVPQSTFDAFMNGYESHTSYYAYAESFVHAAKADEDFLPAWSAGFRCAQGQDESLAKMIQPEVTQAKSIQLK